MRPIRVASRAVGESVAHRADDRHAASPSTPSLVRPRVRGKFLFIGDEKFYVRGFTYGTFRPRADGTEVPEPDVVDRDFAAMAANGFNAVRVYSVPPGWLLDAAGRHGLRVMIGLPVERYIGFLADRRKAPNIEELVRSGVRPGRTVRLQRRRTHRARLRVHPRRAPARAGVRRRLQRFARLRHRSSRAFSNAPKPHGP